MKMRMMGLTEEQRAIQQMCRDFVEEYVHPFVRENRDREWGASPEERWPVELVRKANELGLRTINVPEKYGGVRYDAQTLVIIAEELARGDVGVAATLGQNWKLSILISKYAPQHLQDYWFPRLMEDPTFVMSHAMTEPRGASDRWLPYNVPEGAMETKAHYEDGSWILNGRKQFITNAYEAQLYVVYANTNPDVGVVDGTSSFLIPRGTPGFTVGRENETLGLRYVSEAELIFEDCQLPEDHLLVRDTALQAAGLYFDPGKAVLAAWALGLGVAAYEETAAFAQSRVQGGRLIIQHQLVGAALADMATKLETIRAMTRWAAKALDEGASDAGRLAVMAHLYASVSVFEVCQKAVELWGGMGIMREAGIEKYLRDASVFLHLDGTTDIQRLKLAKSLFPDTAGPYAGPVEVAHPAH
ncbi:MAG: acyl-CoA dehydrogenase family protein [Dehalococcoidia bacterium]